MRDDTDRPWEGLPTFDGQPLVDAFERARLRTASEPEGRARTEAVLEAAAYAVALEAVGRLGSIARADREALAARVRRTLLSLAGLAVDEDDRDALELAARQARDGLRALSGTALSGTDRSEEGGHGRVPPVRDLVKLLRGELDGFASADVARGMCATAAGRSELARLVSSIAAPRAARLRVAADTLSLDGARVRDPGDGRVIASRTLEADASIPGAAFEVVAFEDGAIALYADPPLSTRVGADGATTTVVSLGYVELQTDRARDGATPIVLHVEHGDRAFDWAIVIGRS